MSDAKTDAAPSTVAVAPEAAAPAEISAAPTAATETAATTTAASEATTLSTADAPEADATVADLTSENSTAAQLPPTDKRHVRVQSPTPSQLPGLCESTPRHGRSITPLLRHMREQSATRSERASVVRSWRSITPFLKREEQERTTFEIGSNILLQLASYQAIFDKALVMDVSMEEEPRAKYILSEQSVFDKAAIMDISNVEYVYIEEDLFEEEEAQGEEDETNEEQEGEDDDDGAEEQEDVAQEDGGNGDDGEQVDEPTGQQEEQTANEQQQSQSESRGRDTESPPIDLDEILKPKKPPPKKKKLTAAQKEAARRAQAEAEEAARLEAEEEARRLAEEAELKRLEEERLAAIAAAEAAAAAALAAEKARLLALEKAAEEAAKRDPEHYRLETERREKEYQTALGISRVPHILVHLLDTTVEEGGNLKLACSVIGTDLMIKWYYDGHLIDPHCSSGKYRMEAVGETVSLEIFKTLPSDSGEYMVRIHNDYGDTGNSAIVRIFDVVKNVPALPSFFKVHGELNDEIQSHYLFTTIKHIILINIDRPLQSRR